MLRSWRRASVRTGRRIVAIAVQYFRGYKLLDGWSSHGWVSFSLYPSPSLCLNFLFFKYFSPLIEPRDFIKIRLDEHFFPHLFLFWTFVLLVGIKSLTGEIERNSEFLGRSSHYSKNSSICHLPPYLTVQFVRFAWRADTQKKAKVLRVRRFLILSFTSFVYLLLVLLFYSSLLSS